MQVRQFNTNRRCNSFEFNRATFVSATALGWGWAALLSAGPWLSDDFALLGLMGGGPAAATYFALFYSMRVLPRPRVVAIAVAIFAFCHLVWMPLAGSLVLGREIDLWDETYNDIPLTVLITGVGFALAAGWGSRSLVTASAVLIAGLAAAGVATILENPIGLLDLFFGCAVLHLLIASIMTIDTLRYFSKLPDEPCRHCGYSLAGLPSEAPCPECGLECQR